MRVIDIQNALDDYLSRPVILAEQNGPRPTYPYISIKEMISFIPASGHASITDADLIDDIERTATTQPKMSLSLTAYGKEFQDTSTLIQQAHNWFTFTGYQSLKDLGLVVAEVQAVMNRDSLIVEDYERKRGFDVILRFVHKQSKIVEEIKVVKGSINDNPFITKRSDYY